MTRDAALQWIIGWTFRRDVALSTEARDDLLAVLTLPALTARSEGFRDGEARIQAEALAQLLGAAIIRLKELGETSWELPPYARALSPRETDAAKENIALVRRLLRHEALLAILIEKSVAVEGGIVAIERELYEELRDLNNAPSILRVINPPTPERP